MRTVAKDILSHYLSLGYPLLPLERGGKKPLAELVPRGLKDASSSMATVEGWARVAPGCNWGLLPPERVLVLDVDAPERWPELLADYPELSEAPRQRTPRGGYHVFLRLPDGAGTLSASTQKLPGCDVRGLGRAYLAVAPSIVGGTSYEWERPLLPPHQLPEAPAALLRQLLPTPRPAPIPTPTPPPMHGERLSRRLRGLLEWACQEIATAPEGMRHHTLLHHARLVGGWLHHGLPEAEALETLAAAAVRAGLSEGEAKRTARDGLEYGRRFPLALPQDDPPVAYGRLHQPHHPTDTTAAPADTGHHPLEGLAGGGEVLDGRPRYVVQGGMIQCARVDGKSDACAVRYWPLANFAAVIRREIRATDGLETETLFEIEGHLWNGQPLPRALVKASEFAAMNWPVREWGARVVVTPGQGAKDHLRAAIQYLSHDRVERATVFRHLGWAQVGGRWCYVHAGGGITAEGIAHVEVHPGRILEGFILPTPPTAEAEAERIRRLWEVLDVAPHRVTAPMILYALAAPLGHAPYSLYLAGPTGARKTSLALVLQSFFGYLEATPPLGWEATANSLEGAAFGAKDCLLLIDDYAPTGRDRDWREIQAKAARVLRSQGNAVGRARMRADGTLVGDRPPRGSIIITGEDLPLGHSVRARGLFLELRRGEVDLTRLTEAQRLAREGTYAQAMAAWIRYLAAGLDHFRARIRTLTEDLRPCWNAEHGRTTDALARLHAVWILYREYAALRGVDLAHVEDQVLKGLETVRDEQTAYHRDADAAERFVTLLFSALRMGRCHLAPLEGAPTDWADTHPSNPSMWGWEYRLPAGVWSPKGPRIGWVAADWESRGLFLDPSGAWNAINRMAIEQGEPLPTERTLWKRLADRGMLRTAEEDGKTRYQVRVRVRGQLVRVVHLTPYIPQSGNSGNTPLS